jgi:hypothetical protein
MAISVAQLQKYLATDRNIAIVGEAGTGKTAMVRKAADNLGLRMKYYSASTMDPIIELLGIPVPDQENKAMEYYRDRSIDDADVIFFDEASRAATQTINAIFEITQFKSLNGVPLPKLKSVIIAFNPITEDYQGVSELDQAFLDRFDVFLESKVDADYNYFKNKYGAAYARAGVTLFKEYQRSYKTAIRSKNNKVGYFSPRRLEKLMDNFKLFPIPETVTASLPANVVVSAKAVADEFNLALRNGPRPVSSASPRLRENKDYGKLIQTQISMRPPELRKAPNYEICKKAFEESVKIHGLDGKVTQQLLNNIADALNYGVGPLTIHVKWKFAVRHFNTTQSSRMSNGWSWQKKGKLAEYRRKW